MVGAAADRATAAEVVRDRRRPGRDCIDLVGQTDVPTLAGVLVNCRALVANDSGALHLAAALGVSVTAVFGPTDERLTRPDGSRAPERRVTTTVATVLTTRVVPAVRAARVPARSRVHARHCRCRACSTRRRRML